MTSHHPSRRRFLRSLATVTGMGAMPFAANLAALGSAAAEGAGDDYKALVCLFLAGGNDHYNTVLATDSASWSEYRRLRVTEGASSIALPEAGAPGGVLPVSPLNAQGRAYALHPQLGPLKTLFDEGRAAVVANVGTLVQPTTLAQFQALSAPLPPKLFSHNDQQSMWQASRPEGASFGWGGRIGDLVAGGNAQATFTCISAAGNAVYLSGREIRQYQISAAGAMPIRGLTGTLYGATVNPLPSVSSGLQNNIFENEYADVVERAIRAQATLAGAMAPAGAGGVPDPSPFVTPNTNEVAPNMLAKQLQTVARIIAGRGALGARRQVFFVSLGGFDTHDNQKGNHAEQMARLAHALSYFDGVLAGLGGTDMRRNVTTFTASDFGRTLTSNGDGTDHGWGAHHFVVGGAVKGRDIYGQFPQIGLGHALDVGRGALLPTVSVDQYGATLGNWFGLSATQIADVFPNIGNYASRDLGFMG
ncbi:DUF1501 domain-containing protein [Pseudoduganella namucuonensis]|nr:DUF1501 domain-containing protein [Pseudoduganella namucuonensis]